MRASAPSVMFLQLPYQWANCEFGKGTCKLLSLVKEHSQALQRLQCEVEWGRWQGTDW